MSRSTRRRTALLVGALLASAALLAGCQLFGSYESFENDSQGSSTGCVSDEQCTAGFGTLAAVCPSPGSTCIPFEAEGCHHLVGDVTAEGVLLVGVLGKSDDGTFAAAVPFAELVEEEIRKMGGLPDGQQKGRPVAFVVCDEGDDPLRPARHLVETLHVPVIVGPTTAEAARVVAAEVTIPNQALLVVPFDNTEVLQHLEDGYLVWALRSTEWSQSLALSKLLVDNLAPRVRDQYEMPPTDVLRVVVAYPDDERGTSAAGMLYDVILPWVAEVTPVDYGPWCVAGDACIDDVSDRVRAVAPHAVVALGGREVLAIVDEFTEELDMSGNSPWPIWLLGEAAEDDAALAALLEERPLLRGGQFFTVTEHVPSSDELDGFLGRYRAATEGAPAPDLLALYDALYAVTFARIAARDAPSSGPTLASGLRRLVGPGLRTPVGIVGFDAATKELLRGRPIDLSGLTGELDFDLTTGTAPRDWLIRCAHGPSELVPFAVWDSAAQQFDPSSTFVCEP